MLVTFKTTSYADISMFGNVAEKFLLMMGHSATVPGALMADDVEAALESFKAKLAKEVAPTKNQSDSGDEDDAPVSTALRAAPLLELMEAALASGDNIMWDN